jgi:hypothetical protein
MSCQGWRALVWADIEKDLVRQVEEVGHGDYERFLAICEIERGDGREISAIRMRLGWMRLEVYLELCA